MAYPIKSNPEGCRFPDLRGDRSCVECYYSYVNDNNQWQGSQACWNSQCLTLDVDQLSEYQRRQIFGKE